MIAAYQPTRYRAPAKRLVAIGIMVTLGFVAICAVVMWRIALRDLEKTKLASANVVAAIAADIARNIEVVDLSLQAALEGLELPEITQLRADVRQRVLFDRAATAKNLGSIIVVDANGIVSYDSRAAIVGEDRSHMPWFRVHERNPNAGRFISAPWTNTRGEYFISVTRRISDNDGSFLGVVAGSMRLTFFHNLFRNLQQGEGDILSLTHADGSLIMRAPLEAGMIGRNLSGSPVFDRIRDGGSGSFQNVGVLDGIRRLYVFQRVEDTPLLIANGLSMTRIFAGWWQQGILIGAMVLLLCAINLTLVIFLARALKKRSEAEYQVSLQAVTDVLTGLSNRRQLDKVIDSEWRRAARAQTPVALLMLDADRFKAYNDTFGHQAGDTALAAIAECIKAAASRTSDFPARYGGEEFAVLLPGEDIRGALVVAERIRDKVNERRAEQGERPDKLPTISVGAASLIPRAGLTPAHLIECADRALYQAKEAGRDCVVAAPAQPQARPRIAA